MKNFLFLLLFFSLLIVGVAFAEPPATSPPKVDSGDTSWVLISSALVMLMTPGLALFYGGMVRRKNVLGTIMQSFIIIGLVSVEWVLVGYSMTFGPDHGGIIGDLTWFGLRGVGLDPYPDYVATVPHQAFMVYQMMFAVITPALITGAFAERFKFSTFLLFTLLWSLLVYNPVAHWVWGVGGWIRTLGVLDFAGGAGAGEGLPPSPFAAPPGAAAAATLSWVFVEWVHRGKPTVLGAASGCVAGLVAITPAAGFVAPIPAIVLGLGAGALCYSAVMLKGRIGYDDSLDVVGVHCVGGTFGSLATGLFATTAVNAAGANGLFYGNPKLLALQALAAGGGAPFFLAWRPR